MEMGKAGKTTGQMIPDRAEGPGKGQAKIATPPLVPQIPTFMDRKDKRNSFIMCILNKMSR